MAGLLLPAQAGANEFVAVTLNSATGEGSYNDTLPCPVGDGDSWRYHYSGEAVPGTPRLNAGDDEEFHPLEGTFSSTFAVHDANDWLAYVPANEARIAVDATFGGRAYFTNAAGGNCTDTNLGLSREGNRAQTSGYLPIVADGGTGAMRGLTGEGTAETYLDFGPGADNYGTVILYGEFDVPDPQLAATQATARWASLSDYLNGRLTVAVTVANATTGGDAFEPQAALPSGYSPAAHALPTLRAGATRTFTARFANAQPGRTYTLPTTLTTRDGLGTQASPVTSSVTFRAPATP